MLNTLNFEQKKCIKCRNCIRVCPHQVFVLKESRIYPEFIDHCMECGACVLNCPANAITVKKGVGCAFAFINGWLKGTAPDCDCDSDCC